MQPTIVNTSKQELCLVVVPDDAYDVRLDNFGVDVLYGVNIFPAAIRLSEGKWQYIALHKDILEEVAATLIDSMYLPSIGESRFFHYNREWDYVAVSALESLHSLVASKGLSGKNVAILKRIE